MQLFFNKIKHVRQFLTYFICIYFIRDVIIVRKMYVQFKTVSLFISNANLAAKKINATVLCICISSISSSFNANIWSLRWIHRVNRIRTDLAENLSGSRILRGIDIWGGYITSRDLQKSLVQNWVAGIFVRTTAGTINCEFLPPSSPCFPGDRSGF